MYYLLHTKCLMLLNCRLPFDNLYFFFFTSFCPIVTIKWDDKNMKNAEANFDQQMRCKAHIRWSKYTTVECTCQNSSARWLSIILVDCNSCMLKWRFETHFVNIVLDQVWSTHGWIVLEDAKLVFKVNLGGNDSFWDQLKQD